MLIFIAVIFINILTFSYSYTNNHVSISKFKLPTIFNIKYNKNNHFFKCNKFISGIVCYQSNNIKSIEIEQAKFFSNIYEWLKDESLRSLLSKEELINIIIETRTTEQQQKKIYEQYNKLFIDLINQIKNEKKSLKQIIDKEDVLKLLNFIESIDLYDSLTVKTFLQTSLFENMLGGILYEGIFEFLKKVDIVGNIINKLPIIGPIRMTIMKEFKNSLDKTLGGQIKSFLSTFNKVAVSRMVDFILAPSNKGAFRKANRNLCDTLISRPISDLLITLDQSTLDNIKIKLWIRIQESPMDEINPILTYIYDTFGDITFKEYSSVSFSDVITSTPTIEKVLSNNVQRFLSSKSGKEAYKSIAIIKEYTDQELN